VITADIGWELNWTLHHNRMRPLLPKAALPWSENSEYLAVCIVKRSIVPSSKISDAAHPQKHPLIIQVVKT